MSVRRSMLERAHTQLSMRAQCGLLGLARSGVYYQPAAPGAAALAVEEALLEAHLRAPMYGVRRLAAELQRAGHAVGHTRVRRLMRHHGLRALMPRRSFSRPGPGRQRYPYLLSGVHVDRANQAWATDITYIRLATGFVYVVALLDIHSRYIVGWTLSTSLDAVFCVETLQDAMARHGVPEIVNMDQGAQFTSAAYLNTLEAAGVAISMDGKGRVFDNILIERFWRSLKHEEVYLKRYESVADAREAIGAYIRFYNEQRLHQALGYQTPYEVYYARAWGGADAGTPRRAFA